MKLQRLAIGDRFEYDGKIFVKTGPLTASSETGGQQVIPRYAVLRPLDLAQPEASNAPGRKLGEPAVRAAFERFCEAIEPLVAADRHPELAKAREAFLAAIKK